jgi:O-antigen ligase
VAHNSFLSVLVEQGMVGFLFFSAMFIAVFLALMELPLMERRFALVLLATLCLAMLPLTWEDRKQVWFVLAAIIGLARASVGGPIAQPRPVGAMAGARRPMAGRPQGPLAAPVRSADRDAPA